MAGKAYPNCSPDSSQQLIEIARLVLALLGARDARLREHSERVANCCANFAEAFDLLRGDNLQQLFLAGLLHDIGYISSPASLFIQKPSLTDEDRVAIKKHPVTAVNILSNHQGFEAILLTVRHHHEAFDGSGYPDRKRGEDIPLGARILHLCDHFDRLTAGCREGEPRPLPEALADIREKAGQEFDPSLIGRFIQFAESTLGAAEDFLLKKQKALIKQSFAAILQKFSSGQIVPPVMPQVVFEMRGVIKRQDASVKELAEVIEKDPVISLRLISVANSPVYKGHGEVKSVQAAIPRLGFKETLSVILAIANKSLYEAKIAQYRVLMDKMWVHSLACAYASKLFAQGLSLADPENLFLMGLTHDVGKVILLRAFAEIPQEQKLKTEVILTAIQEAHQSIGSMLLKRWGFGEEFLRIVALHEGSDFTSQTNREILVVHLANILSRKMGFSFFEWDGKALAEQPSAVLLGVSPETIEAVEQKIKETIKDVSHLF
jgi:HD-GYP domain-containing protein (c-di-GMP phosphodiesterase class II)